MKHPKKLFLTKGVGKHREKLASFEDALRNAGLAEYNIVRVSSIYPPGCKIISRNEGKKLLTAGQIVYCVLAENATNEPHRLVAASIGLAIPRKKDQYGYLSEHHSFGESEKKAGDYAEDLAASMLATILGVEFDPDSRVFLFGSRVDDRKKGGDIDLIVITNRNSFLDRLHLKVKLKETLGDQKIDLILTDGKGDPFVDMIKENAILI